MGSRRRLFVIHYPIFGGPHNEALRMNRALEERGWKTVVLLPDEPGNAAGRLRDGGVDVVQGRLGRLRAPRAVGAHAALAARMPGDVARIRRAIRALDVDLVQIGGLVNPHAAIAARLEGVPVVWQILDTRPPSAVRRGLTSVVNRLADAVMFDGEALVDAHGGPSSLRVPWFVYYPPVDTDQFRPSVERRALARGELGFAADVPVVGTVSNLSPQKAVHDFVRAAALVHAGRPDACFVVVGARYETHAAYTARLLAEIRESGIPAEQLVLAGERHDVDHLYAAMDVKVIASLAEGTTTTAQEAMACGVPVVATNVGAVGEVVADGRTGLLVPAADPAALAKAVLDLLADDDLRSRLGHEGRERAVEHFGVESCADVHVAAFDAAMARRVTRPKEARFPDEELRRLLVCPRCRGELAWEDGPAACAACGASYPVADGIPVLVVGADDDAHKVGQAAYFDSVDAEYEITRPHGTVAFHSWLLGEKFRRSVSGIEAVIPGSTAVTVCGGSGMDAEYLARRGARVLVADISLGAARRARERARRFGLAITSVVADAEALPLRDRGVDVAYVHDGLHHLERPPRGLAELTRVAGAAVSVNEPAQAAATRLAIRVGLAHEEEEAGNRIERLRLADIERGLEAEGFGVVVAQRYGMYYKHEAGPAARLLSKPLVLGLARSAIGTFNRTAGGLGNKLTVQAVRRRR